MTNYQTMPKDLLVEAATERGIANPEKMSKNDLAEALRAADLGGDATSSTPPSGSAGVPGTDLPVDHVDNTGDPLEGSLDEAGLDGVHATEKLRREDEEEADVPDRLPGELGPETEVSGPGPLPARSAPIKEDAEFYTLAGDE